MSERDTGRYASYIEGWRDRLRCEQEAQERRQGEALEAARRLAALLAEEFGVRRVILFGSLARRQFGPESDIDLAVEGLEKSKYFSALVEAGRATEFPLEIRLIEELEGLIRERVFKEGMVLYE